MDLFITDECSITWDKAIQFFIYGGIVVTETDARPLAEDLISLKLKYGIQLDRPIKWTNNKWKDGSILNEEIHKNIKDEILTFFAGSSARIIVCLSPQSFYHNPTEKENGKVKMTIDHETELRSHEYGLNDALGKFNEYLGDDRFGLVIADTFGESVGSHMTKHCFDSFPCGKRESLSRIIHPVIQQDNEFSPLLQINDVILGAVYTSLREMGHNFLPRVRDNFWMRRPDSYDSILGAGFTVYPKIATHKHIAIPKGNLISKFKRLVNGV